ncbi:Gfo/Idh/MocA family oxidoreductase [Proteiniphilum sp. UBA5384]|uniref:Gfo/Idh/MocA family oxidoreductase n=1 Tax=Proteiniphilum sp. UBA5384 TaxID=1947279 RepID=UPI0025DC3247|nr:Gfo/Idh/MocA family oxidoreductase [Proteiniphilum sp. UBA5384]
MTTRRQFIKNVAIGASAMSFGGVLPGFSASSYRNIKGSNDRIRIAGIGVNARGGALARGFADEKDRGCVVTDICDVDSRAIEKCIANVEKTAGNRPRAHEDIRKMLESDNFDAVFIATPDHWHAPAALMAMKAGKHVYLEKPTSHNPDENRILLEAEKKYGKVVQVGNQRRSWPNVAHAMKELHEGIIGDIYYGKSWYYNKRGSMGIGKVTAVPEWLNWELWQGPAPRMSYKDNIIHYDWHWIWHWGTGEALNNGMHFVDLLRWGMQLDYPISIDSTGGRFHYRDDWETPDTQLVNFTFANGKVMTWESQSCVKSDIKGHGSGVTFYGSKGTLTIGGGNEYTIFDLDNKLVKHVDSKMVFEEGNLINPTQSLDAYHFQNFFNAIRKGEKLNSSLKEACVSTQLVQLANISHRVGRTVKINNNGTIANDREAMKFWKRDYEKGWELKV